jgi:hypothetical protein
MMRFLLHFFRALRLDSTAYAEVARQRWGVAEGAAVVLLGGLARGIGAFAREAWTGVVGGMAGGVAVWMVAALAIWCVGLTANRRAPAVAGLLAALGLAAAPLVLLVFLAFDSLARIAWLGAHAWATLAAVLAVREVEQVSTARAVLLCAVALAVGLATLAALGAPADGVQLPERYLPCG